jgi:hypothetical protein
MADPEGMTQVREGQQEQSRGKKRKAIIKRGKSEPPLRQQGALAEGQRSEGHQPAPGASDVKDAPDRQLIDRIQERAYRLYEADGYRDGYALEHWLEAERQITGSDR